MKTKLLLGFLLLALVACTQPESTQIKELPQEAHTQIPTTQITATPTPLPTLTPEILISDGDMALFVGDYETAYEVFESALKQSDEPQEIAESRLGLGQALLNQDEAGLALIELRQAADSGVDITAARANYLLGQTYTHLERYDEAIAAYETYLQLRPGIIDSQVHGLLGDLNILMGDPTQAIVNFQQAYLENENGSNEGIAIKLAKAYQQSGDEDTALTLYKDIYNTSDNDYTKAQMDLLIGRIYETREEPDQAFPYYQDAVNNFPYAYDAYTSLTILDLAGVSVNNYQRGLVHYYVGNYSLAIEAFDRYLTESPQEFVDGALYYKALATRAIGGSSNPEQSEAAITLWESLIENHTTSPYYIDAWEDIEYTLWAYLGEPERAAEHALSFTTRFPEAPEAPAFLFLAGRSFERAGMLTEAAQAWLQIADNYPTSDETFRGIFFAGIAHVRLGEWALAQPLFARSLVLTGEPAEIAAAYLWIGKCQEALGDISAALDSWKQAQISDPFGHYSIRAEDLLIGRGVFSPPDTFDLNPDLSPYQLEAEAWLRERFSLSADTNLESPGLLANDPRFQQGIELWALGHYEAGKLAFEAMRQAFESDPAQTFRLIPALVKIGLYRSALIASTNLLKSAGLEGAAALDAPEFFSHVRFGAYYLDWLLPIAEAEQISPLLLLAIIRQESTFEGFIRSGAGARGLMQIIPSTGEQLARELNWPQNYTADDLYRPYVSLLFGANYLKKQRNYFDGDLFAMLAAYNGGPGNTIVWNDLTPSDDPDLFLEIVRIEETRNYIRLINETYYIYRWLYGSEMEH
ncbi:MAG: tetratricopeptide repeat protein [Anaerolineales bacterium]